MVTPRGSRLSDPDEPLYRQVHPAFVHDGRISSQAFRPTRKDEGLLSVARGALTTPEEAYRRHTQRRGLPSRGVARVAVGTCEAVQLGVWADPETEPVEDPAHAVIDFRGLSSKEVERRADRLAAAAREAGGSIYEPKPAG